MIGGSGAVAEGWAATGGMKILKRSRRRSPKVSFVLLDWSVRESFHLLHYLSRQTAPRDDFEVIVVEYYSRESPALRPHLSQVDTWAILGMPSTCYYHKHVMYNAGIVLARGDILVFCDSDAMARENFVQAIVEAFDSDPNIILHLDQFRNMRRDFYPFNFPSFDAVLGPGCINNRGGRTKGIADPEDPLHELNYGACMCARRLDLIAIGGADEHLDYLGHICGPYEMTFRLANFGRREMWHATEFLYHTWHPGQAGVDNYLGPHDGRHMSTTALEALSSGRVKPHVENWAIQLLRENSALSQADYEAQIVAPDRAATWRIPEQSKRETVRPAAESRTAFDHRGFRVERDGARYSAHLIIEAHRPSKDFLVVLEGGSVEEIQAKIDGAITALPRAASALGSLYLAGVQAMVASGTMLRRFAVRLASVPGRAWNAAKALGRRTIDRVRRFGLERARLSGSLASLIVNLHALRQRPELAPAGRRPVLLTDAPAVAYYMRVLAGVGVIPRLDVVIVRGRDIRRWSAETSRAEGPSIQYIVGRDFYFRHHSVFVATGLAQRTTVL
jgi:hypothetical protein